MLSLFIMISVGLGYLLLAAAFYLFFFDRNSYKRDDLGAKTWTTVLLYDIVTLGAYGMFWRLRATYVLGRGRRYPAMAWFFIVCVAAYFEFAPYGAWVFLILWDLSLRAVLKEEAKINCGWVYVLLFGHLALVHTCFMERDRLPADFGSTHGSLRSSILKSFSLHCALAIFLASIAYGSVYFARLMEFNPQPDLAVGVTSDRAGYWSETRTGENADEVIYHLDAQAHKTVYRHIQPDVRHGSKTLVSYQSYARPAVDFEQQWSWFSCISKKRIIEQSADRFVTESPSGRRFTAVRIDKEEFAHKKQAFKGSELESNVWAFQNFLKSPWSCETMAND